MFKNLIIVSGILFLFTGCFKTYESINGFNGNNLKVDFADIKGFENENFDIALETFKIGCTGRLNKSMLKNVCLKANETNNSRKFFKENFTPFLLVDDNGKEEGTITGYYEPLLYGSLKKSDKYKYPIYKIPSDMIIVDLTDIYPELKGKRLRGILKGNRLVSYPDREEFEKNYKNKDVLAWVDDKIDLYFLHIQGSGKVQLDNGDIINVGYDNQNGHKYVSLGKYMSQMGYIGGNSDYSASVQGMKKWFEDNPGKVDEVLNRNPSYVFFGKRSKGATGSLGTELIAKRNIAVDRRYIKLGLPVFLNTKHPVTKENIDQIMVAADTGGAIKGKIRADFFWGFGEEALESAGRMKENGKLYIFIPNDYLNSNI